MTAGDIEFSLVRGGVKNINLRVCRDGSVRLSVPYHCPTDEAVRFVVQHTDWIHSRQKLVLEAESRRISDAPSPAEIESDKRNLEEILPDIFERYERLMGVRCSRWRLRRMVSRWGSCNVRTGVITINTELAHLPRECLESVVVHELCHLRVSGHNAEFYALMDTYYPQWREARKILNANPPRR